MTQPICLISLNQSINQMVYFVLQHKCWIKIQETLLSYIQIKTNKKVAAMIKKLYQYLWIVYGLYMKIIH